MWYNGTTSQENPTPRCARYLQIIMKMVYIKQCCLGTRDLPRMENENCHNKKNRISKAKWVPLSGPCHGMPIGEHTVHNWVSARGLLKKGVRERVKGVSEWGHNRDRQTDRTEKRQEAINKKDKGSKRGKRSQERQGRSKRQESELCPAGTFNRAHAP